MPSPFRAFLRATLAVGLATSLLGAQAAPPAQAAGDTARSDAVRVFLDCQSNGCDRQFFTDEMKWVNLVRDRLFADAILLVTSLRTGAGGTEHTVTLIGAQAYAGRADTAVVHSAPDETDDVMRRRLLRTFRLLLGPYVARTGAAQRLNVAYSALAGAVAPVLSDKDPWNFWVFRLSANGYGNGEKRQTFSSMNFNTSASRVTARWKTTFSSNLSYDQSKFDLGASGTFNNIQRDYGGNALVVKSLSDHWSAGFTARALYSDFSNYDLNLSVMPAIEWDYYPYKEFTSRQLTAFYNIGMAYMRFQDTTIYGKVAETHPLHSVNLAWNARQPWGSVNVSVFGSQYLHDRQYHSYGISGFTDLRLTKGLSLNIGGNYSRVNDQLYLRRGTLTDTEIIARQQALATNYRYFVSFGISYTFGSIFNTVVNPRFNSQGGGGGGMIISF